MKRRPAILLGILGLALVLLVWNAIELQPSGPEPEPPTAAEAPTAGTAAVEDLTLAAFPERVVDGAGTLRFWAAKLGRQADAWREDLGVDFHVVTVAAREPLELAAPKIFELRRIGEDAPTGGMLLVLDPERREARIEPSYELESVFPDALLGRLADDQLAPYASYDAAGMAVMDVLHLLKDRAFERAVAGELALVAAFREGAEYQRYARYRSGGGGAQVEVPAVPLDADLKAPIPGDRRARYAPSADPQESLQAFLRATADLAGDPTLPLFTPGSQEMRARYPLARFEERQRLERIRGSEPLQLSVEGDRAAFTSPSPAPGFVPILLRRIDGTWRVDNAETWKNLFYDAAGDYALHNSNNPYLFALGAYDRGRHHELRAWSLDGRDLRAVIAELETKEGAFFRFLLAELLFRNCFAALDALRHYEEAVERAPRDPLFRWTLVERALYLGFPELAIPHLEKLGAGAYLELARVLQQIGRFDRAHHFANKALARNPLDRQALRTLESVLRDRSRDDEAAEIAARRERLESDPARPLEPVEVVFEPPAPRLVLEGTRDVGGHAVFDWSDFAVTLTNRSARPVVIERVRLRTLGTEDVSGLGDIKGYWSYGSDGDRLAPGQSARLFRTWGYSVDTENQHITYLFDVCWHAVAGGPRQCAESRVEVLPL